MNANHMICPSGSCHSLGYFGQQAEYSLTGLVMTVSEDLLLGQDQNFKESQRSIPSLLCRYESPQKIPANYEASGRLGPLFPGSTVGT